MFIKTDYLFPSIFQEEREFTLAFDAVSTTSANSLQSSSSQSSNSLAADGYVISNAVVVEEEKGPVGLVEEISQELDQMDSARPGSSHDEELQDLTTAQDKEQDFPLGISRSHQSPSHLSSDQQDHQDHQDHNNSNAAKETTTSPQSDGTVVLDTVEITKV